jgi:hypothetical protein
MFILAKNSFALLPCFSRCFVPCLVLLGSSWFCLVLLGSAWFFLLCALRTAAVLFPVAAFPVLASDLSAVCLPASVTAVLTVPDLPALRSRCFFAGCLCVLLRVAME